MKKIDRLAYKYGVSFIKHGKKALAVLLFSAVALLALFSALGYSVAWSKANKETIFWQEAVTATLPECCAVCENGEGRPYHAPVLVNLSTGEIGEMQIYDPDLPGSVLDINPIQQTGTFSFARYAGLTGRKDTCSHTSRVEIPKELEPLRMEHFCRACRAILAQTASEGFALLDLFNLEDIKAYAVLEGAEYTIRDYAVRVYWNEEVDDLTLEVLGQMEGLTFID
ncbi:MAG: hypothetical protein IIV13_01255 [Bacteroidaceae bacterium]|nr:hypothetical protein [Bacteroidaceae bacterium]